MPREYQRDVAGGNQKPDCRTINHFRGEKLRETIEEIFVATVRLLKKKAKRQIAKDFLPGKDRELLASDEYKRRIKRRSTECETVFGRIKTNQSFRRFHLCGTKKVGTEWGLLMTGYDLKQIARLMNA